MSLSCCCYVSDLDVAFLLTMISMFDFDKKFLVFLAVVDIWSNELRSDFLIVIYNIQLRATLATNREAADFWKSLFFPRFSGTQAAKWSPWTSKPATFRCSWTRANLSTTGTAVIYSNPTSWGVPTELSTHSPRPPSTALLLLAAPSK